MSKPEPVFDDSVLMALLEKEYKQTQLEHAIKALEFYANEKNWEGSNAFRSILNIDKGERAREVLRAIEDL